MFFISTSHNTEGSKILDTIQDIIRRELFIPEEFKELVVTNAKSNHSVAQVLNQLKEPKSGSEPSIPWLGEVDAKEWIIRLCSQGCIAINLLGREMLESRAGESESDAWQRMKGRLATGRQLEETTLHEPGTNVSSGGFEPIVPVDPPIIPPQDGSNQDDVKPIPGLFDGTSPDIKGRTKCNAPNTSSLTLS